MIITRAAQSCIFNKSLSNIEAEAFEQLTIKNKEVPLAKGYTVYISPCGKSLI